MTTEDENPDRLCEPQYHLKETIRKVLNASKCISGSQSMIEEQERRLKEEHQPEKDKRELELQEWMRRAGQTDALFQINDTQAIRVVVNKHYKTLTWTLMELRKP